MRWLLISLLALPLMVVSMASAADRPTCDMKRVAKVLYCVKDKRVLTKTEVGTGKPQFSCAACNRSGKAAGACPGCEQEFAEATHAKGACPACGELAVKADACVKDVFACPKCAAVAGKSGKCASCSVALKKTPNYALLQYVCGGCGENHLQAGKCKDKTCPSKGKALARTCSQAGTSPHVKPVKAKKPKKEKKPKKKKEKKSKD